ncbi:MAG TPA: hypothetical protein DCZ05_01990 [Deltaproteobacteria bacterium]|nr:hypothetical protein [Deltaproteobacteria bacterium]
MNHRKGFTLVEVIVILVVLSILAAMAVPVALRIFERTAEDTTREEMDNVKKALLGDPQKLQTSFRNDFGLLGDIGCLPSVAFGGLDRLLTQGSYLGWNFNSTTQTGAGWKGPYITGTPGEDFKKDQLGNDYTYTPVAGTCPLTATLTSNGPDGQPATADDITVTIVANETTATVRGSVKNASGVGLRDVPVEIYYPENGAPKAPTPTATTDANGNYSFPSVPFGARSVKPNVTLVLVPGSITVTGGNFNNVNFQVTNYSGSAFNVTGLTVTCPSGVGQVDDVEFDGSNVENPDNSNRPCGTLMSLSGGATSFSGNSSPPAALRVFVDSADTQLPDLILRGGGTTRTITLQDFETSGGSNIDMRNRTLTVTFTLSVGGPAVITFTTPP